LNVVVSENHKIVGVTPEGEKNDETQVAAAEVIVAQGCAELHRFLLHAVCSIQTA